MRTTSDTWKSIVANGEFHMESVARIYGATGTDENGADGVDGNGDSYREYATITAPVISRSLLSGDALSVGNAIAGQLKFAVMTTDTIPKSAKIVILARVKDDENVSEWLEFGTFWIDHRTVTDNIIDIEAYDAMKKGNQPYADDSQTLNWPKTIKAVVQRIAVQMGVDIDNRTITDVINDDVGDLDIVLKPSDEMSLLDILGHIGAILGGNWTITPDNELRYVQITSPIELKGYLLDNEENIITTYQGNKLLWQGDEGSDEEDEDTADVLEVGVVINSLTTASKYTVSKVTLALDSEHVYTVGDDSGYELVASTGNPYASADMAQLLYSRVQGVEYDPFEASNAIYDPAAELGDFTVIGTDISSVIYNETQTLNIGFSAEITAPGRDEMEDEYPYRTLEQKQQFIAQQVNQTRTMIEQTQSRVTILAEQYTPKSTIRSTFALDPTNITLSAGIDGQGNPTGRITFNSGTLVVNSSNFSLDSDGVMTCYGANINGALDVKYTPPDYVPREAEDVSFEVKIDKDGFRFVSNNSQIASIYNDVWYDIQEQGIVNSGLCIAGNNSNPLTLKANTITLSGNTNVGALYCGGNIYVQDPNDQAYNMVRCYNNSVTIGDKTLTFVNGLLLSVT